MWGPSRPWRYALLAALSFQLAEAADAPSPIVNWPSHPSKPEWSGLVINAEGKTERLNWKSEALWNWEGPEPQAPALRIKLESPDNLLPVSDSIILTTKGSRTFAVDLRSVSQQLDIKFEEPDHHKLNKGLILRRTGSATPIFWLHPSCEEAGLRIQGKPSPEMSFLFAGARCINQGETVELIVAYSSEARLTSDTLPAKLKEGTGWVLHRLTRPASHETEQGGFSFEVSAAKKKAPNHQHVWLRSNPHKRFIWDASLSTGYESFSQSAGSVSVSQLNLSAKIGASFVLVPGKLDLWGDTYLTLLPILLKGAPDTQVPFRLWGLDAYAGYTFAAQPIRHRFKINVGYFAQGMLTGQTYGYGLLRAPEFLLQLFSPSLNFRRYQFGLKYAVNSDSFSLKNAEIGVSGAYQLSRIKQRYPLFGTFDISTSSGAAGGATDTSSRLSISAGLRLQAQ